jgi:hypothetical protein
MEIIGQHWRDMLRQFEKVSEEEASTVRQFFYAGALVVATEATRHATPQECANAMQAMITELAAYCMDNRPPMPDAEAAHA